MNFYYYFFLIFFFTCFEIQSIDDKLDTIFELTLENILPLASSEELVNELDIDLVYFYNGVSKISSPIYYYKKLCLLLSNCEIVILNPDSWAKVIEQKQANVNIPYNEL